MKMASFLRDLAMEKVLNGGPEAADRLEAQAAAAIHAENWDRARQLLRWRLEMRYPLEQKDRATIGRLFRLMDEVEAKGIVDVGSTRDAAGAIVRASWLPIGHRLPTEFGRWVENQRV